MIIKKRTNVLFFAIFGEVAERRRGGACALAPAFLSVSHPLTWSFGIPQRGRNRAARERRRALPVALAASETAPSLRPSLAQSIPPSPNGVGSGGGLRRPGLATAPPTPFGNAYRIEVHTKNAKST